MPEPQKLDPTRRQGTYRSRVFVGGSYLSEEQGSRLDEIKLEVVDAGYQPVIAREVQLENEADIHHETMVQLHSCRLAVFELSQLSGALMEIERVVDYGIRALVLFAAPSGQEYLPSRMLSTFINQHDAITLHSYLSIAEARRLVRQWLKLMRQEGFGHEIQSVG